MRRIKIIADDKIPFLKGVLEPYANIIYLPANLITSESVRDADALLIRTRTRCDARLLKGSTVKFIASATIGYDHINTVYCKAKGITWVNAPGCNSASVQQYVTAALLTLANDKGFNLSEKTLGIIGVGNVGSKVQKAASILGMNVKLNDPPRARKEGSSGFKSLDEILETSDIITIHVPLNMKVRDRTLHLFDTELFGKMKTGSWLFNTSRGEVVETNALKTALSTGKLGGAVLDVWENEPEIDLELLSQAYISTPHIAGYSIDGKAKGTSQVVQALSLFFCLPLLDFYPPVLPEPSVPEISIDGSGKSSFQIIHKAVLHTYPIMQDHILLQSSPADFEQQRGRYPVRREFPSYTVRLLNGKPKAIDMLYELGFKINKNNTLKG